MDEGHKTALAFLGIFAFLGLTLFFQADISDLVSGPGQNDAQISGSPNDNGQSTITRNVEASTEYTDTFEGELGSEYVFDIETVSIERQDSRNGRLYYRSQLNFELTNFGEQVLQASNDEEVRDLVQERFEKYPEREGFEEDLINDVEAVNDNRIEDIPVEALKGNLESIDESDNADVEVLVSFEQGVTPQVKWGSFSTVWSADITTTKEIYDWSDLQSINDDIAQGNDSETEYILMNDLNASTPGYNDYMNNISNYTGLDKDAGLFSSWSTGDTIGIRYNQSEYESISVEDGSGNEVAISVSHPTITIEEDTGSRYVSVIYENAEVGWNPIGDYANQDEFTGVFDGNGYAIQNLTLNRPDSNNHGLFGATKNASKIENITMKDHNIRGNSFVGGIVGYMTENDTISNVYLDGRVVSLTNGAGGVVGWSLGTVNYSYTAGVIEGDTDVGGVAGRNNGPGISYSYSSAKVYGQQSVGGIAGYQNGGNTTQSYAYGNVTADIYPGGLIGLNNGGNTENSYWDVNSSGQTGSDGGTGLNTTEMQGSEAEGNMTGFDFQDIWTAVENGTSPDIDGATPDSDGYPILEKLDGEMQLNAQGINLEKEDVLGSIVDTSTDGVVQTQNGVVQTIQ